MTSSQDIILYSDSFILLSYFVDTLPIESYNNMDKHTRF
jgi:hypothetical protein